MVREVDAALACDANQGVDRQCGLLGLERNEQLGDLGGQAPGLAAVGAGLRIQRLEPAGAIETEPVAHGLHGDPGTPGPGDGVGALGFLVQGAADLSAAQRHTEHVGDEAVAEQRDGFAQLLIGVVHGRGPRRWGRIGPGQGTLRRCRRRVRPHLVLARAIAIRRVEAVGVEPQRCGQCAQLRGGEGAQRHERGVGVEPGAYRAHLGDAPGEALGKQADDDRQDVMDQPDPALDPAHRSREFDRIGTQRIARRATARGLLGGGDDRFDLIESPFRNSRPKRA